jgi:predicted amino acid dehydrogenase
MMATHHIATLHFRALEPFDDEVELLGKTISVRHLGCDGDLDTMARLLLELDGQVGAIALQGVARHLRLGPESVVHADAERLFSLAQTTPVVDGTGVRAAMERWAVQLAHEAQPGIWARKRVLMVPGLNHHGLAQGLAQHTETLRYADPVVYFALPGTAAIAGEDALRTMAGVTLAQLRDASFRRLFPQAGTPGRERNPSPFEWADVLAGDMGAIRRYAPAKLRRKIVVTNCAEEADVADLAARGVSILVTVIPSLGDGLSRLDAATFEACLAALRASPDTPLTENTYLNLMAELDWQPGIRYLQPEEAALNRFAFVIHPLSLKFVHSHPWFRWTRFLPDTLVERVAAHIPPLYISRVRGIRSAATGQQVEGLLLSLGGTPRELMRHDPAFVYRRLIIASRMAERWGARLMGLGAFTSVVGDAGITVAQKADIAVTSGNSLTVAATLETAKEAAAKMGHDLSAAAERTAMVVGATGSIGAVCSRLLAQAGPTVILVAPRPEKLIALKRTIEEETPGARVLISTSADEYVGEADLIVTTTSAVGQRIIDIMSCKPGAVICDIARPPDVTAEEAALRPDVLVIESGEILLPGEPDYGYDIGLPPGVAYACLAETALLAMEGRFEDYTLGRNISVEKVKEIYRLFKKHGLRLSGLRSHGEFLTDADIARKRALADELRRHPERLERLRQEADAKMAKHGRQPASATSSSAGLDQWLGPVVGLVTAIVTYSLLRRDTRARTEEK